MNKRFYQLFETVGQVRPVVSAWKHFPAAEQDVHALAQQTVAFQKKYQWDFVKINPRATYYAEAFGNRYDHLDYTDVLPKLQAYPFHKATDLDNWAENVTVNYQPFKEQVQLAKEIRSQLGPHIPILQTLFSPLSILTFLAGHNPYPGAPADPNKKESQLLTLLEHNPQGAKKALECITNTCIQYVKDILHNDIDGFFYSIFGHGNLKELPSDYYDEFSAPYDQKIFKAIKSRQGLLMFHTCGPNANPQKFASIEEIDILHWADRDKGNPNLNDTFLQDKLVAGGVDQRLFTKQQTTEISIQANQAIQTKAGKPFVLTAGCGLPVETTSQALFALRQAAFLD